MKLSFDSLESREMPSAVFAETSGFVSMFRDGQQIWSVAPYPGYAGGILSIAAGDVNGDGIADAITGAGPGGGPHVKVLDGSDGREIASFFAYDTNFSGGVYVGFSGSDDRSGSVLTGAGPGGGPHVKRFAVLPAVALAESYFVASDSHRGGVQVAGFASGVLGDTRDNFESRPDAKISIFLSFTDTAPTELIPGVWRQVADAFATFNVNITTVQPTGPANTWATVVIGGKGKGFAAGDLPESARGVAIVNGFFQSNPFEGSVAHVFADRIGWSNPVMIGRAIAHEAAHLFGVGHSSDPRSIMFEGLNTGAGTFDTISFGILRLRLGLL